MPPQPAWQIIPTSKLTADNAGDLELTSHRRVVASAAAALTAPSSSPSSVSPLPDSSPPPQTDTEDASSQGQVPLKRPQAIGSSSLNSVIVISPTTSDNAPNSDPRSKKAKTSVASSDQDLSHLLLDVSIISIDNIDNPHNEWLNKSHPTADIKQFFSLAPRLPGQPKRRMRCNLCV